MRVGFFVKDTQPHIGGGYSFINTIQNELVNKKNIEIVMISDRPHKNDYGLECISIFDSIIPYIIFRIKRKICKLLKISYTRGKRLKNKFQKERIDIVWILGPFEFDSPVPYIFTVWDIGHRTIPYFPEVNVDGEWENRERLYKRMLYKASYIITGNEIGKQEILENYPMNPDKIKVVNFPNPLKNVSELRNSDTTISIEAPYIFYPAQFWSHKNHVSLIEAVKYLHEKNHQIHCYFTGSDKGNMTHIGNKIKEYNLEKYIHMTGFVDDSTLVELYKNALALTFVSLLGPNNLPPIEAISLGCPVIISNIPGHLEQMGDAALAVDATDPIEIGNAVIRLLSDPEFRKTLIDKGYILAEKQKNYSYFDEILAILSDFQKIRKTWQ